MKFYLPDWWHSLFLVLMFLAGSLASAVLPGIGVDSLSVLYAVSMAFPLAWGWLRSYQLGRRQLSGYVNVNEPRQGSFRHKAVPLLLAVSITPCASMVIEPIASLVPMSDSLANLFEAMFDTRNPADLVISTVILAPLCEELLCRGLICRGMLVHHRPAVAIAWSAFIFALLHGNLFQGVSAFCLGILFGWVYWKTHSLWCTIAMHFTNNALSVAMMFIFPDLEMDATYADIMPQNIYIFALAVAAALMAACIYLLNSKIGNEEAISFEVRGTAR